MQAYHQGAHGTVTVGTVTGAVILRVPYAVQPGQHAAVPMVTALSELWTELPALLVAHGQSRFDFVVRQGHGDPDPLVDLYYASGMDVGRLLATVARKLVQAQRAQPRDHARQSVHTQGVTVTEVEEEDGIEWVPPDHVGRVLATLAQVQKADDVWGSGA